MKHYVALPDGRVFSFRNARFAEAAATELQGFVATSDGSPAKDTLTAIPTAVLVTLHNVIRPEKPIKKFESRDTAEKRLQGVLEVLAKPGETPASLVGAPDESEGGEMATKKKRAAKKASGEPGAGRPSKYAGMKIVKVEKANPRKANTSGFKSWELLRSGMTYEAYMAAGGVRRDLEWDLDRGWVKLEKA